MNNKIFNTVFIIIFFFGNATLLLAQKAAEQGEDDESGYEILKREEYFYVRRAGGAGITLPDNVFEQAIQQARAIPTDRGNATSKTSGTSWVSVNPTGMFYAVTNNNYISGRTNSYAFHPSDPDIFYIAAAGGGVWKTTDGGVTFTSLSQYFNSQTCGAVAIDPNYPDTVYVGTGEQNFSLDSYGGDGIYKSTDGGSTWTKVATTLVGGSFSAIVIDPSNSNTVYAAGSKGVYKSTDGGGTWTSTNSGSAVNALLMDPTNTQTLYISTGGSGANAIKRSLDGGSSWTSINSGVSSSGRVSLAMAHSNPSTLYASAAGSGGSLQGLYRTTNGGGTWTLQASSPNYMSAQGWYDNAVTVSPTDPDFVVVGGLDIYTSTNAGVSLTKKTNWSTGSSSNMSHADIHVLAFNGSTLYVGSDGGVYKSTDNGTSWTDMNATISSLQFQSADYDPTNTQRFVGGCQDNNLETSSNGGTQWIQRTTGDGGYSLIDPVKTNYVYGQYVNGSLKRSANYGVNFSEISPNGSTGGNFYNPYELAPGDHNTIVYCQSDVWKTSSALTATSSNGWVQLASSAVVGGGVNAIAISAISTEKIYIGVGAKVMMTTNNGGTWTTSTGFPTVTDLALDNMNDNVCYASCGGTTSGRHVFKTTDGGATWINISGNLPNIACNSIVLRITTPRMIFVGTDLGVFQSTDDGANWVGFNSNLPPATVYDLKYTPFGGLLLAATHGRGCYTFNLGSQLDDFVSSQYNLSYGRSVVGDSKTDTITVKNLGSSSLNLSDVSSTDGSFTVSPTSGELAPGAMQQFFITFTPTSAGAEDASIVFTHNGMRGHDTVAVHSNVYPSAFLLNKNTISFGNVVINTEKKDSVTITNLSSNTLSISDISTSSAAFTTTGANLTIEPFSSEKFYIAFMPSSATQQNGYVVFSSDAESGTDTVWVSGNGLATAFVLSSSAIDFGDVAIGASKKDSVMVTNGGTTVLHISAVTSTNAMYTVSPRLAVVQPQGVRKFYITYAPTSGGTNTTNIIFTHDGTTTSDTVAASGNGLVGVSEHSLSLPKDYALSQNYPNPFNPTTNIKYALPIQANVTLKIYNVLGLEVATIFNGIQEAGYKSVDVNAGGFASGIYFYRLKAQGNDGSQFSQIRKMILLK